MEDDLSSEVRGRLGTILTGRGLSNKDLGADVVEGSWTSSLFILILLISCPEVDGDNWLESVGGDIAWQMTPWTGRGVVFFSFLT